MLYSILLSLLYFLNSKYYVEKCDNTYYYDWAYVQKLQLIKERLWDLGDCVMVKAYVKRDEEVLAIIVSNVHTLLAQ